MTTTPTRSTRGQGGVTPPDASQFEIKLDAGAEPGNVLRVLAGELRRLRDTRPNERPFAPEEECLLALAPPDLACSQNFPDPQPPPGHPPGGTATTKT
jgi:hypothetical protein